MKLMQPRDGYFGLLSFADSFRSFLRIKPALARSGELIRGAHWFSRHDPITFWDAFDGSDLTTEFRVIRKDGFNTLFLLLPWHAFFENNDTELESWHRTRLIAVLSASERSGLRVIGRLFYAHSAARDAEQRLHERQYQLLRHPEYAARLAAQAQSLARVVSTMRAWGGAFISWEDFWPVFEGPPHWELGPRLAVSQSSGFSTFVDRAIAQAPTGPTHLERHGDTWAIPTHASHGMVWWIRFFGEFLTQRVIHPCTSAFPTLGAEVRVDAYPIRNESGGWDWQYFDLHDTLPGQRYAYWGPYYGQHNEGEELSAEQAIRGLSGLLDRFPAAASLVIDQLNFRDTTLHFASKNAALPDAEVGEFLRQCAILLTHRHCGYALWAYRDYRENWVANPTFQRGSTGWQSSLGEPESGTSCLHLRPKERVWQTITPAHCAQAPATHYTAFHVEVQYTNGGSGADIMLLIDNHVIYSQARGRGYQRWEIPGDIITSGTAWNAGVRLQLQAQDGTSVRIRQVSFWGFVQELGVRNHDGTAGPFLSAVQTLNATLWLR